MQTHVSDKKVHGKPLFEGKSTSDFFRARTCILFAGAKSSVLVVSWTFLITFCALTSIGTSFLAHLKCLKTKKKY